MDEIGVSSEDEYDMSDFRDEEDEEDEDGEEGDDDDDETMDEEENRVEENKAASKVVFSGGVTKKPKEPK
jgi:hypothetical protein